MCAPERDQRDVPGSAVGPLPHFVVSVTMVCEEEYELLEQIGRGSYGKVYRAQHDSGEVHAIKVRLQSTSKSFVRMWAAVDKLGTLASPFNLVSAVPQTRRERTLLERRLHSPSEYTSCARAEMRRPRIGSFTQKRVYMAQWKLCSPLSNGAPVHRRFEKRNVSLRLVPR